MAIRRRAALFAAAVAVMAAVVVGFVAQAQASHATLTPNGAGPTSSTDPNEAAVRRRVERTLANVPMLPDAVRLMAPPVGKLAQPPLLPGSPNLIDQYTFWRAQGTVDAAIDWFTAHTPSGMTVGVRGDGTDERYLAFQIENMFTDQPTVLVDVVPDGEAVAIRVDVMAVWTPTRLAWAHIGAVDSVDITVQREGFLGNERAPTVHRTLTGAPAQRLADALDGMAVYVPGRFGCAMDSGFSDDLVFRTRSGRTVEAVAKVGGCDGVQVTADGASTRLSGDIDEQLMAELGLPANYGR